MDNFSVFCSKLSRCVMLFAVFLQIGVIYLQISWYFARFHNYFNAGMLTLRYLRRLCHSHWWGVDLLKVNICSNSAMIISAGAPNQWKHHLRWPRFSFTWSCCFVCFAVGACAFFWWNLNANLQPCLRILPPPLLSRAQWLARSPWERKCSLESTCWMEPTWNLVLT